MKSEIVQLFHEFHTNAKLSYGINSSFMALIPKRDSPSGLGDYRPISLVSSIYKMLAKVLSKRIKQVLLAVISEVQSTFVSGRHILDGVLIANEVVDRWHKARKKGIILKLDFEKAYDSLSWDFLLSMLGSFGFGARWIRWMKTCVITTMVSVLVNGSPTEEFQPQKGLRQGDPLSPFLFIVAAEGLNLLLGRAIEKGLFKGASVGSNQLGISHLQFADDTIIFCEGGLPLGANPRRKSTWDPVVAKFQKKLSSWKRRLLSYAGRLTLIKSALYNLPIYFLSIFKMPKGVVKAISKIQANFLWGSSVASRKVHMVKWKEVTKGKNQGGLGIRDLGVVNECLLLKWWWRYGSEDKALCKEVIYSRYGKISRGWSAWLNHPVGVSLVWKDISQLSTVNQQLGEFFGEQVQIIVGNGRMIKFWYDPWLGDRGLKDEFTRLFSLSTEKEDSLQQISAKIGASGRWQRQFRRPLLAWEEEELQRLVGMLLFTLRLIDGVEDSCSWLAEKSGQFTVASVWRWRVAAGGNDLWWNGGRHNLKSWVLRVWKIIPSVVLWSVWRLRNQCLFKDAIPDIQVLCEQVKVQKFTAVRFRSVVVCVQLGVNLWLKLNGFLWKSVLSGLDWVDVLNSEFCLAGVGWLVQRSLDSEQGDELLVIVFVLLF
ncbi:uncharacterized protein LOC114319737 [Camellia sinensis]|uniref:uncharacterized protein LOC114319737 n=1 Tax=Camellia sinensis TaxID=4442 RepID=UPI0010365794|nr:uncharacterized protein LOC114319737 [Camellia sinensis]